jgi:hypothetical protein
VYELDELGRKRAAESLAQAVAGVGNDHTHLINTILKELEEIGKVELDLNNTNPSYRTPANK